MIKLTTEDRLDIIELQSIYAWGIDGKEGHLFARAFTEDIVATYPAGVTIRGLELFTRYMDAFHEPFDGTHHFIANHWIVPGEEDVTFRSYVTLTMTRKDMPGGDVFSGGGYYIDRVVPTEAGWRIAARDTRNIWRAGNQDIIALGREAVAHLL
jgi:hypothetical protein